METSVQTTYKEFLLDSYKCELNECKLIVTENWPKEEDKAYALIFDKTIFHAQGGGQPSDEGFISFSQFEIPVEAVGYDRERDVVLHKVSKAIFENSGLKIGDLVDQKINKEKRLLYARLHSAGHLLDISVSKLGLNLVPGKGYHFPDGPYVEYNGNIDKSQIDSLIQQIQKTSNEIIESTQDDNSVISKFYEYEEGKTEFGNLPAYLQQNKPFRWVKLQEGDRGCPCGGTHVKHLKDIINMKISKITNKGKVVRISYNLV